MDGTSSLDQPTGTRKYSMAAPSAGERAAKADRMDQAASDRMLSRTMRDSSQPASVRIAAAKEQQSRRDTPGYVNGRGIRDAEQNRNQDSQTADKFTAEGLRLQGKENPAEVVAGQAADAVKNGAPAGGAGIDPPTTDENGFVSAPTPSMEPSAPTPATTPPVAPGEAASGTPSADPMADRAKERLAGIKGAVVDSKAKFANDLKTWGATDPKDRKQTPDQILAYGAKLGLDENQINAAIRGDEKLDTGSAALSAQAEAKGRADKAANTPEAKAKRATADFGKAYGDYLNGAGKTATKEEKDAKYAELKGKAVEGGFEVTKEAKDKAAWISYEAKVKAAKSAGIDPNTVTSKTDFGEEAKALIPGAKKELQGFIDAADIMTGSTRDAFGDFEAKAESLRESRGALEGRASTEIGDKLQSEVVPDNVKAARESLSGLDGGGWDLAKGQEMLDQQTAANKPTSTKTPETGGPSSQKPSVDDGLGWLTPGVDPKAATKKLKFAHGYSDKNITELLNGRGITESAAKDKKGQDLVAAEKKAQDIFDESVIRNPPNFSSEALKGTYAGNVWDWFQDPTGEKQAAINRQKQKQQPKANPTQASNDAKLQQRAAAYQAPIDAVLERSNFLQRYA